jgi:hypothetical protein
MRDRLLRVVWVAGFVGGLGPGCSVAQTVPAQGARYRIEVAGNVVTLTDLSAIAVTGFRGTYDCGSAGKPSSVAEDSVILGMGTAEQPKSSLAFQEPSGECTGGIDVIVFADGQHVGGPDAWKRVVIQRSAAYAEVTGLLALAEGVPAKDWKLADLVGQIGKLWSALRASQNMGVDERRGRLMVLETAMNGLPQEEKKAAVKTPAASRTLTVTALIRWINALDGALGKDRVEMSSGLARVQESREVELASLSTY